jgi:hypothetical protein
MQNNQLLLLLVVCYIIHLITKRSDRRCVEGFSEWTYRDNLIKQLYYHLQSGRMNQNDILQLHIDNKLVISITILELTANSKKQIIKLNCNGNVNVTTVNLLELLINGHTMLTLLNNNNSIRIGLVNVNQKDNSVTIYSAIDTVVTDFNRHSNVLDLVWNRRKTYNGSNIGSFDTPRYSHMAIKNLI